MSSRIAKSRLAASLLIVSASILSGCQGAEAQKRHFLEMGRDAYAAADFEGARADFRKALTVAPNDSEALYQNGLIDEKLGNLSRAAQFYRQAIDTDGDNVAARAALGKLYLIGGSPERGAAVVQPSLVKHPDSAFLLTVRAAAKLQLKDAEGALADAETAVKLAPYSEEAVSTLAGVYEARSERDKARALLEKAVQYLPDSDDLRAELRQVKMAKSLAR